MKEIRARHRADAKKCAAISGLLFSLASAAVAMQIFAVHCIMYCYKEELPHLWLPVWSLLSLGGTIAIFGILLNQCYGLINQELPAFSTALGTPVLVVCAIGHLIWCWTRDQWLKWQGEEPKNRSSLL